MNTKSRSHDVRMTAGRQIPKNETENDARDTIQRKEIEEECSERHHERNFEETIIIALWPITKIKKDWFKNSNETGDNESGEYHFQ